MIKYTHFFSTHFSRCILCVSTLLCFIVLFTSSAHAVTTNSVTEGSFVNVTISNDNIYGITCFEKKPKMFFTYQKNGKDRTRKIRIVQKGKDFKDTCITQVTGEVKGRVPLSPPAYPLYVIPRAKGIKYQPIATSLMLSIVPPVIQTPNIMGEAGDSLTITGMYFGVKKPKIWLSYIEADVPYFKYGIIL